MEHTPFRPRSPFDGLPPALQDLAEQSTQGLADSLSEALKLASSQLLKEAREALGPTERETMMAAAELAQHRSQALVTDFRGEFGQRFARACQPPKSLVFAHQVDFDSSQLAIIEHHCLDDAMEPGKIVDAIQSTSWQTQQRLTGQFQRLLDMPSLAPTQIPLSPAIIEAAVVAAIQAQPWRLTAKDRLAHALRWPLAVRVGYFYKNMLAHFPVPGASPALPPRPDAGTAPAPSPQASTPAAEGPAKPADQARTVVQEAAGPLTATPVETPAKNPVETAVEPPVENPGESAAETSTATPAEPPAAPPTLQAGQWVSWQDPSGEARTLKLHWVSPRGSLFLFTDPGGKQALSITAPKLAAALESGRMRPVPEESAE